MTLSLSDAIAIIAALVATSSAVYARYQTKAAQAALAQQSELRLFEAFSECSNGLIQSPGLLNLVHGLPEESCKDEEGKAIAYLCAVLDAFQIYYHKKYSGDFNRMETELKAHSNFLSKILANSANGPRIHLIRWHFYGNFDAPYMNAIEKVMEYSQNESRVEA